MKLSFPLLEQYLQRRHIQVRSEISRGNMELSFFRISQNDPLTFHPGEAKIYHAGENLTAVSDGTDTVFLQNYSQEQTLNLCLEALHEFTVWENDLYQKMCSDTSLQELLEIGQRMFFCPMSICNAKGWQYASAGFDDSASAVGSSVSGSFGSPASSSVGSPASGSFVSPASSSVGSPASGSFGSPASSSVGSPASGSFVSRPSGSVGSHASGSVSSSASGPSGFLSSRKPSDDFPVRQGAFYTIRYSKANGCNVLNAEIWVEGKKAGAVMLYERNVPFTRADIHLLFVFHDMITRYVSINKGALYSRSVLAQYLIDMLERKSLHKYEPARMLHYLGWEVNDTFCVLAVAPGKWEDNKKLEAFGDTLDSMPLKPQTFLYSNRIICLIRLESPAEWSRALRYIGEAVPESQYVWGISHTFRNISAFADYYAQSCHALSHAIAERRSGMTMREIAIHEMCNHLADDRILQSYLHPDIRLLENYDKAHKSEYAATLFQYLFYSCNYTDAAKALHLHRNTLIYRIDHVKDLITADLENEEERKLLLVSFLLSRNED